MDEKLITTPMKLSIELARDTMTNNIGGPFGAAVVDSKGQVVAVASNTVLRDNDPTAHAEVNAIRAACRELGTYDLTGCTLIATAYPCPMCLSAIMWANIKTVYYGCTANDTDKIGFRDDFMYHFIEGACQNTETLALINVYRDECLSLFKEYSESQKQLY